MEKDPSECTLESFLFNEDECLHMLKDGDWYEHACGATKRAYGQFPLSYYVTTQNDYDIVAVLGYRCKQTPKTGDTGFITASTGQPQSFFDNTKRH